MFINKENQDVQEKVSFSIFYFYLYSWHVLEIEFTCHGFKTLKFNNVEICIILYTVDLYQTDPVPGGDITHNQLRTLSIKQLEHNQVNAIFAQN